MPAALIADRGAAGARPVERLAVAWRARAVDLRRWGAAEGAAVALEQAAAELEAALSQLANEPLSLREAALASGYSVDHLGRLVRNGTIPSVGRPNRPRIRRGDLPVKPTGRGIAPTPHGPYNPATDARDLWSRRGEP